MKQRLITAVVGIAVLLPILWFSDTYLFPAAVAICSLISVFEMLRCLSLHRIPAIAIPTYVLALALPFGVRLADRGASLVLLGLTCIVSMLYCMMLSVFFHGTLTFAQLGEAFLVCMYILVGFNAIVYLRDMEHGGQYLYLLVFVGAWITDSFAYFSGRLFGKHKLIPHVSPKKTVEGSIGGTLFCVLSFLLFGLLMNRLCDFHVNYLMLAVSGLIIALVSQIGDLCMSVIKRERGIKDYGNMFPGHGGMMDRFDSILAVAATLAVICSLTDLMLVSLV